MQPTQRVKLRVNSAVSPPLRVNGAASPAANSPSTGATKPRLKLNFAGSKSSTPIEASAPPLPDISPVQSKKSGRATKPTAKAAANKHRLDDHNDIYHESPPKKAPRVVFKHKKKDGQIKLKVKGKPPIRPGCEGYDSEASDQEEDPAIEEGFIWRWLEEEIAASAPGFDCTDDIKYWHQNIDERKLGAGGQVSFKFLDPEGRRAMITVRENHYAATMADIPTIIEAMKTWDRKTLLKSIDISQVLLVFAKVKGHEEARSIALPRDVDPKTFEYPDGLTPPMRRARQTIFRPVPGVPRAREIEYINKKVSEIELRDHLAYSTEIEWINPEPDQSPAFLDYDDAAGEADEDADGEADEDLNGGVDEDLARELEDAFLDNDEVATPATDAPTPILETEAGTPAGEEVDFGEDLGDEQDDDDEDDDEEEEDGEGKPKVVDEAENKKKEQREEIKDLEKKLEDQQLQFDAMPLPYLRTRIAATISSLKQALAVKKAALGEEDDDDDNYGPS